MKRTLHYIFLVVLILPLVALGQDARFSQYYNNPLLVNPALAGNGIEYVRVSAIYRNQWAGLGDPFTTQGIAVDKVVSRVGIGGYITRHGAGDAGIRTIAAGGNLSYHLPFGYKESNSLSLGMQVGLISKSFDQSKLTFDNQYTPDIGYDPNIASGETFSNTGITRGDLSLGIFWQRGWNKKKIRLKPYFGLSIAHLNEPQEIFIEEGTPHPSKLTVSAGAGYMLNDKTEIRPSIIHMEQGPFNETTFGSMISYELPNKNVVQMGIYDRINDAVIAYAGYSVNQFMFGFSYDVNTSALSRSGNGMNAFELSLTYSPKPKKKKRKSPEELEEIREKQKPVKVERNDVAPADVPVTETIPNENMSLAIETTPSVKYEPIRISDVEVMAEIDESPVVETVVEQPVIQQTPSMVIITGMDLIVPEPTKAVNITDVPAAVPSEELYDGEIVIPTDNERITEISPIGSSDINTGEEPSDIDTAPSSELYTGEQLMPEDQKDSDGDGIADSEDACPFIGGTIATNGCPDSDSDGIIDMKDDCPMDAGSISNNGCPDRETPTVGTQTTIRTYNNILFDTGRDKLRTDDIFDIIERAIDLLYANPDAHVILSGHTDSEGGELTNMKLSEARTDVVKNYMIKQGIAPERISAIPYGETMPLEENNTEEGKQQNRRVEINIIRK
jgi:type IX secretion system PorP/SprF family membrane protein